MAETPVLLHAAAVPSVPHETPEVIAAKAAHFAAHAQARAHLLHKRSVYSYAPAPIVQPDGHLADTPEVAAAKAAHFAEHAKRGNHYVAPYAAAAVHAPHNYYSHPGSYYKSYAHHQAPIVTPSGYLADTPEVAAAKAAHFAEKAKVSHYNAIPVPSYNHIPTYSHVPTAAAYPQVGPDGHVLDTPEVAAAKAAHLSEHIATAARDAALSVHEPAAIYPTYSPYLSSYYAAPVVNADGHLADTPEVAHAKAAHLAEYAAVASRQKRSVIFGQTPAHTVPLVAAVVPSYAAAPLLHTPFGLTSQSNHVQHSHAY